MSNDLVVVVPGIMGSALYRGRRAIWDPSVGGITNALATLGGSIRSLTLPAGIGDNAPDDGIYASHLLHDVHVIPGLWTPIRGYNQLLVRLRDARYFEARGNLMELPYDWRASITCIVRTETPKLKEALRQWRSTDPANTSARIVFVCHSMGGLVARRYAANHPDDVAKVITIATPSRGSVEALKVLTHGVGPNWGWLQDVIIPLANSLPGLHHLLPAYPCVDTGGGYETFADLKDHPIKGLDMTMARAGIAFLDQLARDESANGGLTNYLHPLIGWKQKTLASLTIADGVPTFQTTYGALRFSGDGTVPLAGAVPKAMPLDTPFVHGFPDQHGNLQENDEVGREITRILTDTPDVILRGEKTPASLSMPDLLHAGDDLVVEVGVQPGKRDAVAVVLNPGARDESEQRPSLSEGRGEVTFRDLSPGVHTVELRGTHPGSAIQSVTATIVSWSRDWDGGR